MWRKGDVIIKIIDVGDADYKAMLDMRNKVLRLPLGLNLFDEKLDEADDILFVAYYDRGGSELQVAVKSELQGGASQGDVSQGGLQGTSSLQMVGCCILTVAQKQKKDYNKTGVPSGKFKMRQVAVRENTRGLGIGKHLMLCAESYAIKSGFAEIFMSARDSVYTFYEKLGYKFKGKEYIEVGLPHKIMYKKLPKINKSDLDHLLGLKEYL
ncbi:MAG: GNAT family N-acetyltransferase [Firmicutes bacterium]|nr:GNAT family N-acetyltransferase [Bacillota bacterium]